jgi:hypothetical protein
MIFSENRCTLFRITLKKNGSAGVTPALLFCAYS